MLYELIISFIICPTLTQIMTYTLFVHTKLLLALLYKVSDISVRPCTLISLTLISYRVLFILCITPIKYIVNESRLILYSIQPFISVLNGILMYLTFTHIEEVTGIIRRDGLNAESIEELSIRWIYVMVLVATLCLSVVRNRTLRFPIYTHTLGRSDMTWKVVSINSNHAVLPTNPSELSTLRSGAPMRGLGSSCDWEADPHRSPYSFHQAAFECNSPPGHGYRVGATCVCHDNWCYHSRICSSLKPSVMGMDVYYTMEIVLELIDTSLAKGLRRLCNTVNPMRRTQAQSSLPDVELSYVNQESERLCV